MTETLPAEFWQGVEQFNRQEFYACHDTLEALWIEAMEPEKRFYQGILQVAVAFYHLSNQNWRGSVILLGEGMSRLRPYLPEFGGIDVEPFLGQVAHLLTHLQETGPEQVVMVMQQLGFASSEVWPAAPVEPGGGAIAHTIDDLTLPLLTRCESGSGS